MDLFLQIAKAYGLSQRRCLLVDDDQDNLEDAQVVLALLANHVPACLESL
jgi:hypothetical protein